MKLYNKLVRDKIPEIMISNGVTPVTKTLNDADYIAALEKKLNEEVDEYHKDKNIEELADILEVVYALCEAQGFTVKDLLNTYEKKHDERGGFSEKIFLVGEEW